MNIISETFISLNNEGKLKDLPSLVLLDIPRDIDLQKCNHPRATSKNSIYVFGTTVLANSELNIKDGTAFDVIISRNR